MEGHRIRNELEPRCAPILCSSDHSYAIRATYRASTTYSSAPTRTRPKSRYLDNRTSTTTPAVVNPTFQYANHAPAAGDQRRHERVGLIGAVRASA